MWQFLHWDPTRIWWLDLASPFSNCWIPPLNGNEHCSITFAFRLVTMMPPVSTWSAMKTLHIWLNGKEKYENDRIALLSPCPRGTWCQVIFPAGAANWNQVVAPFACDFLGVKPRLLKQQPGSRLYLVRQLQADSEGQCTLRCLGQSRFVSVAQRDDS